MDRRAAQRRRAGFAPALAMASAHLKGFIFVDAVLPYPGKRWADTASADFLDHLRRISTGGDLPPLERVVSPRPDQNDAERRHRQARLRPRAAARAACVSGGRVAPRETRGGGKPTPICNSAPPMRRRLRRPVRLDTRWRPWRSPIWPCSAIPPKWRALPLSALRERLVDAASSATAPKPV